MKWVLLSIFAVSLLLLRPYQLENSNLTYSGAEGDDYSYLSHATALTLGAFPSYAEEHFNNGIFPMHSIGPGLLAAPFVYLFSRIDALENNPVLLHRDGQIRLSWITFGFAFSSIFFFCLSCMLLYGVLRVFYSESSSVWATILLFVFQGFPLFAYRRPVFSHVYELFCQTLFLYILLWASQAKTEWRARTSASWGIAGGIVAALIVLVRYNNIFMAISWPIVVWRARLRCAEPRKTTFFLFGAFGISIAIMMAVFKLWPTYTNGGERYQVSSLLHFHLATFQFITLRFIKLLLAWDWGLIWTLPFTLIGLVQMLFSRNRSFLKLLLVPVLVNLAVTILFATQGGWYGYRYLIFTLTPVCAYGFAEFLENRAVKGSYWRWILPILALFPLFSMLAFEGNSTNLTLQIIYQDGRNDWGNDRYQLEVWKTLFLHPLEFAQVIFKGIPAYVGVLVFSLLGKTALLPASLMEKYPDGVQLVTLIRSVLLLAIPLPLGAAYVAMKRWRWR